MDQAETIIITGATGNLGRAVTQKMVDLKYRVIATREPDDPFQFDEHPALSIKAINLLDEDAVYNWIKQMQEENSNISVGVLLVGGFSLGDLESTGSDEIKKMYSLNFETAYHVVRPLLELFKKQDRGGQIILVGARPALRAEDGQGMVAYALSKSLLFRLAEMINAGENRHQVRASVIVPGIIDTPVNRAAMPDADPGEWVPPGRIAEAIGYLLSESGKMLREPVFKMYNRS